MHPIVPNSVCMFDDEVDGLRLVQDECNKRLKDWSESHFRGTQNASALGRWFDEPEFLWDCAILDVVGHDSQLAWVENALSGSLPMERLAQLSGIGVLNWLRYQWPRLPVVMLSAFFVPSEDISVMQALRCLTKCAVCGVAKASGYILPDLLWVAQQAIVGVRVSEELQGAAVETLREANAVQNHFYFVPCLAETDLISPPTEVLACVRTPDDRLRLHEAWNGRVLGLMEDAGLSGPLDGPPFLPFGGGGIRRFSMHWASQVRNMGMDYAAAYLLRECARTAYGLFFEIRPHPVDAGECIFDSSTHAPDLLSGIERGQICPSCELQLRPHHALGGWSRRRRTAAARLVALANERLSSRT